MSAMLGESGVPVAYLFFPDRWTRPPREQILRIGIGMPTEPLEMFEVDVRATVMAQKHGCEFRKYDPSLAGPSLASRFGTIILGGGPLPTSDVRTEGLSAVFVEGEARHGFVADMLALTGESLLGGTMTVLRGHTVACWTFGDDAGPGVAAALRERYKEEIDAGRVRVEFQSTAGRSYPNNAGRSMWIAWKGADRPGVLSGILEELFKHVSESLHADPQGVDVKYAISRVLTGGNSCAGKLNLVLSEEVGTALGDDPEAKLDELREALAAQCLGDEVIRLTDAEPGEEPWASLVIQSNI